MKNGKIAGMVTCCDISPSCCYTFAEIVAAVGEDHMSPPQILGSLAAVLRKQVNDSTLQFFLLTVINVTMVEDEQTLQMVLHKSEFEGQTWLPCQPRYGCRPCASRKKAGPCVAVVNLGDA